MTAATPVTTWRNRIVRSEDVPPSALLSNPKNYRRHPEEQKDAFRAVKARVGYVARVLVQEGTGVILDGHLRTEVALEDGDALIPVDYVDVDDEEADYVLATFDPLTAMAWADHAAQDALLGSFDGTDDAATLAMIHAWQSSGEEEGAGDPGDGEAARYTDKVDSPIYTPTQEEPPPLSALTATTRHDALLADVEAADVPEDVKAFLRQAATRHIVFDYRNVAEYYAHAPAPVQRLMEDSALVIIDFDRAIELGYARLKREMGEMLEEALAERDGLPEDDDDGDA